MQEKLLRQALTHCSVSAENNQRLEYLGDALVNCFIAAALYQQFPQADEGELTLLRSKFVSRAALTKLAKMFDLGKYLFLGAGQLKNNGRELPSILSCALEAVIAAIYLDSDYITAQQVVLSWYKPIMSELTSWEQSKDAKTLLQELLQSQGLPLPIYTVIKTTGAAHQKNFVVTCQVANSGEDTCAHASSRRLAEQQAAAMMLRRVNQC